MTVALQHLPRKPATKGAKMPEEKAVSRREFLKIAGVAGATIGVAGGLGGLVSACGGTKETGTTVSASVETGREIKVGCVVPKTGALAPFAGPFDYVKGRWEEAVAAGVVCGDGKKHPIKILVEDTQSDTARCGQVTGDLITNSTVDVVFAGGAPDTMNPAGDTCEAMQCPGLMIQGPWQAFYFLRGGTPDNNPFKWSYALCVGIEAMAACFVDMWDQISTNKVAGLLYSNGPDGQSWANEENGGPFVFKQAGYTYELPGLYQAGSDDYTVQISQFNRAGAEICSGAASPPDFTNFWSQSLQQNFKPKICTMGQALNFLETVEAIGPTAIGLTTEVSWHPDYPYKSALSGETCRELADDYETKTGKYWSAELIVYSLMEWYIDALKRVTNVDDKQAVIDAISTTKVETIYGPVDFTMPVDPAAQLEVVHPVPNCLRMPTGAAQWVKGDKWPYEKMLVSNKFVPGAKITKKVEEIKYS
jgi:branched-chain amino acid transport system substrate-binding protein